MGPRRGAKIVAAVHEPADSAQSRGQKRLSVFSQTLRSNYSLWSGHLPLSRINADKPGTAHRWHAVLGLPAGRQAARRALPPLASPVTVQGLESLGQEIVAEPATTTREPRVVPIQLHSHG
jgi:hypothetical protein